MLDECAPQSWDAVAFAPTFAAQAACTVATTAHPRRFANSVYAGNAGCSVLRNPRRQRSKAPKGDATVGQASLSRSSGHAA